MEKELKGLEKIPGSSFTPAGAEVLTTLLNLVAKDDGYWPTQKCFLAADKAVSRWAAEVVILKPQWGDWPDGTDKVNTAQKVLLVMYGTEGGKGAFKPHWTLPGSRGNLTESIADAVKRIGEKEIGGADVQYTGEIIMDHKWLPGEHPDGAQVLSLYTKCHAMGIVETENRRFWPINDLPDLDKPDAVHCRNLKKYFDRIAGKIP